MKKFSKDEVLAAMHDFAREVLNGDPRQGQDDMLLACIDAIESTGQAVFDAPTGTGKSIALMFAMLMSGKKGVVSTGTRYLQDQYLRDAPTVVEFLRRFGLELKVATLKGRSAYACRNAIAEPPLDIDQNELAAVAEWAEHHPTGEWDACNVAGPTTKWQLSVDADECLGDTCPQFSTCFAYNAKRRCEEADLVIVNHKLFSLNVGPLKGSLLPKHDIVALDECHEAPETVADTIGAELRFGTTFNNETGTFVSLAKAVGGVLTEVRDVDKVSSLSKMIRERLDLRARRAANGELPDAMYRGGLETADGDLMVQLRSAASLAERWARDLRSAPAQGMQAQRRRDLAVRRCDNFVAAVWRMGSTVAGQMVFVELEGGAVKLRFIDVDIAPALDGFGWHVGAPDFGEESEAGEPRAVLMCSGTVPVGFHRKMGTPDAKIAKVAAPFNYNRTRLYVPSHLTPPSGKGGNARQHQTEALGEAIEITRATLAVRKSVLMLCTSLASADIFAEAMREALDATVITQRDGEKGHIIARVMEAHARGEGIVVCASQAFYTGVDCPRAIGAIIMDKAPMAPPNDPIFTAEQDLAGDEAFTKVVIPHVAAKLGQGAGRLMRCLDDWGVIAILDPRMRTTGWAKGLWRKLPPSPEVHSLDDVRAFLAAGPESAPTPSQEPRAAQPAMEPARPRPAQRTAPVTPAAVPEGRYAVELRGELLFLEAQHGRGRWAGRVFAERVAGDRCLPLGAELQREALTLVAKDPIAAMARYGRELGICGAVKSNGQPCGLSLTDEESRARGIGPVCFERLTEGRVA